MEDIPNKLQCAYCIRNCIKGGECKAERSPNDENSCLIFKADKKGCIRNKDLKIPVTLYSEIPLIDRWCDNYTICGVETEIRIRRIHYLSWDKKNGYLYIHCNCDYYINEFHKNYTESKDKTTLKIIK